MDEGRRRSQQPDLLHLLTHQRRGQLVRGVSGHHGRPLRVLAGVRQHGQLRVGREQKGLAGGQLRPVEGQVVASLGAAKAVVVGIGGLDHHTAPRAASSRPAGGLTDERESLLGCPVVREVERQVGVHDPDHRHRL